MLKQEKQLKEIIILITGLEAVTYIIQQWDACNDTILVVYVLHVFVMHIVFYSVCVISY